MVSIAISVSCGSGTVVDGSGAGVSAGGVPCSAGLSMAFSIFGVNG